MNIRNVKHYICFILSIAFILTLFPAGIVNADEKKSDTQVSTEAETKTETQKPKNEGTWIWEEDVWKYQKKNGDYMKEEWAEINNLWYYFYEDGTMASYCYIGGYWMNEDGSWTYPDIASWRYDGRWWYGDDAGWYAYSAWYQIDGKYYYFDSSGYVATNRYIDGYYVNSNGEWDPDFKGTSAGRTSATTLEGYFANSVVVGDSICSGFATYCGSSSDPVASELTFMANVSFGIHNALTIGGNGTNPMYMGSRRQIWDSVALSGADHVYFSMGMNDIGYTDSIVKYQELIDKVVAYSPGIQVTVCSITGVYSGGERSYFTNSNVNALNSAIKAMCMSKGYGFIDLNNAVSDGYGLASQYCSDNYVHQTNAAYAQWLEAFKEYGRTEIANSQ